MDLNKLFFKKTSKQKNSREPRTKGKSMHWDSGGGRAIVCTVAKNACFFFLFICLFFEVTQPQGQCFTPTTCVE